MSRRRVTRLVAAVAATALAAPASAFAHANLIRSDPPDRAVLGTAPSAVRLYFDDAIRVEPGSLAVRNGYGSVLGGSVHLVGDRELIVPLRRHLPRGDYTILWRALSDDGHPIAGVTTFAVGAGRAPPHAALSVPNEGSGTAVVARWLFFVGLLTAVGAAMFRVLMPRPFEPQAGLLLVSFIAVIGGGAILVHQASVSTRFGLAVGVGVVIAAGGAAVTAGARRLRRRPVAGWVAGLLLLPIPSIAGHAVDPGRPRIEFVVDLLHVAASSVWIGGVLCLALALRRHGRDDRLLRRFSTVAAVSVAILAATGVIRALSELSALHEVWTTSYGRWLLVKTTLFAFLIAIGWMNRYRILPAIGRSASALRRNVAAELLLFAGVIGAVAFLTQSRPGRNARINVAAASPAISAAAAAPGTTVLQQRSASLAINGRVPSAVMTGGRIVWETLTDDQAKSSPELVQHDVHTRATRVLAQGIASQFPLASTPSWIIYATATVPPRLIAVSDDGASRVVLSSTLVAPFSARGDLVAWAEENDGTQRVVTRNMVTGRRWVAATMPACEHGRCYRIDAVTLADQGVIFDRGAIGAQPSLVVRRSFSAAKPESVRIPNDPQPDLVPSSKGALYYAFGQGWYEWNFGDARPRKRTFQSGLQPVRLERNTMFVLDHRQCRDSVVTTQEDGRRGAIVTAGKIKKIVGAGKSECVSFSSLSWVGNRPLTTWLVATGDPHSDAGSTSVIVRGPPAG